MRALALALLALAASCTAPQRVSRTGHTYAVAILDGTDGTGWLPWQRLALEQALPALHDTGDRWVLGDEASADLVVRSYAAASCGTHAGVYVLDSRRVYLDPAGLPGPRALQWGLMHEAMHFVTWTRARWAGHVCESPGDAPDCTALVRGESVLAPAVPEYPDPHLTPADHELLRQLGR